MGTSTKQQQVETPHQSGNTAEGNGIYHVWNSMCEPVVNHLSKFIRRDIERRNMYSMISLDRVKI